MDLNALLAKLKIESKYLKAHAGALAAGYAVYLADSSDGKLSAKDVYGIIAAVVGAWGLVYKLPNK